MELLTGALLKLIHQALQKMKGKTGTLRGGAPATIEVEGERFQVWTTNLQTHQQPPRIVAGHEHSQHPKRTYRYSKKSPHETRCMPSGVGTSDSASSGIDSSASISSLATRSQS